MKKPIPQQPDSPKASRRHTTRSRRESASADLECNLHSGARFVSPLTYTHRHDSMRRYAELLALRHDAVRTQHAYYRQMRLIMEHFATDPASLGEDQLRDYLLHVKTEKRWQPQTIRQCLACARAFYVEMLGRDDWRLWRQVRTRDHDRLPEVLTRGQVRALLAGVRLRRYRTPLKLIYCCGLRLSECLALTIHDILAEEHKLVVRGGKGARDRFLPLPDAMLEDLRGYWKFHRHPVLLFPNTGRGVQNDPARLAARMRQANRPMPHSSLQRLLIAARGQLDIPAATVHTLRHSFATHLLEAGAHLHTIQQLLGHRQINSTMIYLHLTHQGEQDALRLMEHLCAGLPR